MGRRSEPLSKLEAKGSICTGYAWTSSRRTSPGTVILVFSKVWKDYRHHDTARRLKGGSAIRISELYEGEACNYGEELHAWLYGTSGRRWRMCGDNSQTGI